VGTFYPYGEQKSGTAANEQYKFATYWRDGESGLDYAMNRYYSSTLGRFLSHDSTYSSIDPKNPQSFNRYSYVLNDPVNSNDPTGLMCPAGMCGGGGESGGGDDGDDGDLGGGDWYGGMWAADFPQPTGMLPGSGSSGSGYGFGISLGWVAILDNALIAAGVTGNGGRSSPPSLTPNCASAFVPELAGASHYDVLYRVLNENSYGLGAEDLLQEDLYIVSVLENRVTTPGAGNLANGVDSRNIDNQARYAGNPGSLKYSYPNLSILIANKFNLPLTSANCQSFLQDISTAEQAIQQVLSTGSVNESVFFWYTAGYGPLPSYVGALITTTNNNSFYGLP
jgi:RHS repeat-associated protein